MNLIAIQCEDVRTFEAEQGSRTGHSAHAVSRLASVRAQAACAILPRNDAMDVTRLQFLAVLVPLEHRLWHSDNLNSECTLALSAHNCHYTINLCLQSVFLSKQKGYAFIQKFRCSQKFSTAPL